MTTNRLPPEQIPPAKGAGNNRAGNRYVIALIHGGEHWIFVFDDAHRAELFRTFGRFASTPDLAFNFFDAATLAARVRALLPDC